jgi:hypothetical protein
MDKKVSTKIIMIMTIFAAAVLTAPSSALQLSHAQTNTDIILVFDGYGAKTGTT